MFKIGDHIKRKDKNPSHKHPVYVITDFYKLNNKIDMVSYVDKDGKKWTANIKKLNDYEVVDAN